MHSSVNDRSWSGGTPFCTQKDEAELRKDGSHTYCHTATGWPKRF